MLFSVVEWKLLHYLQVCTNLWEALFLYKKALLFTLSLSLWMIDTTHVTSVKHQKRILQFIFTFSISFSLNQISFIKWQIKYMYVKKEQVFSFIDANEPNNKMWNKIIQVLPRDIDNPFIFSSLYRLYVLTYHLFWPLNLFLRYCVNFGHKVSQLKPFISVLYDLISTYNNCKLIFILLGEDTHLYLAP